MIKILLGMVLGVGVILGLAFLAMPRGSHVTAASAPDPCPPSSITIQSVKTRWVDHCKASSCIYLEGAGKLTNTCSIAVGVQIRMTGYDANGTPLATKAAWPASVRNIPPGDYTFSLDQWLDYNPSIKSFDVAVESTRVWR